MRPRSATVRSSTWRSRSSPSSPDSAVLRHAILRTGESDVAAPAAAASGDHGLRALPHEVGDQPCSSKTTVPSGTVTTRSFPLPRRGGRGRRACPVRPGDADGPRTTRGRAGCGRLGTRRRRRGPRPPFGPTLGLVRLAPHRGGTITAATGAHLHVDLVHERHAEQPRWSASVVTGRGAKIGSWSSRYVWMVHLGAGRGRAARRCGDAHPRGSGLEFVEESGADLVRLRLDPPRQEVAGLPVLMVDWRKDGEPRKTAFYFSQPPPLEPVPRSATIEPRGPLRPSRAPRRRSDR